MYILTLLCIFCKVYCVLKRAIIMGSMKLKYQTAIATLIQFIALVILNVGTGAESVVSTCHDGNGDCVSNLIVSLIYFLLLAVWFGFIWILGYEAQEKRSKRLAQALIIAEMFVAIVALFNAKHHTDPFSLITSLVDFGMSLWVMLLAYRLIRADGGRIVTKQQSRKRRPL
jgi:hypothetical protein